MPERASWTLQNNPRNLILERGGKNVIKKSLATLNFLRAQFRAQNHCQIDFPSGKKNKETYVTGEKKYEISVKNI